MPLPRLDLPWLSLRRRSAAVPGDVRAWSRWKRVALHITCALSFALGFGYHVGVWTTGAPPPVFTQIGYQAVVVLGVGTLWVLLANRLRERQVAPARTFWTTLLAAVLFLGIGALVSHWGRHETILGSQPGFDFTSGVPLVLATVIKTNVLGILGLTFSCLLLLRLRVLVLYKRSKQSQRNWYALIGLMVVTSLSAFMRPPTPSIGLVQAILLVPTVALMLVNAFRLSWIVRLSLGEKMAASGLSLLLLAVLTVALFGSQEVMPGASVYVRHYSYPVALFSLLALHFGMLYCVTAFLSLLFHLPTTSDYQRKAGEMAALHQLTHLVSHVFDADKLFARIVASPVEAGTGDAAWLSMYSPETGSLKPHVVAAEGVAPGYVASLVDNTALHQDLSASREALLLDQAALDHRVKGGGGGDVGTLLGIPLIARDEMLGALFVAKEITHGFEKDDVEAINIFAAQAALALDNARLFTEQIEKTRLARELDIAREVQQKLLPQSLPKLRGLRLAASSVAAQEVGGDYYDVVRIDENRLAFIVADVSGKGTSAAFYMAEMQGIFQSVSRIAPSPKDFLGHANCALAAALEKNVFISAIYGVVDVETETIVMARAGHCPAALMRLDGTARYVRSRGMGLGLDRSGRFERFLTEETFCLKPGDVFALYTDGVVESRDGADEEYGYDRLLDALQEHRHEDAGDLHDSLIDHLGLFLGEQDYDDDMTLLVLKWDGLNLGG